MQEQCQVFHSNRIENRSLAIVPMAWLAQSSSQQPALSKQYYDEKDA